jgi:hypothetical protein
MLNTLSLTRGYHCYPRFEDSSGIPKLRIPLESSFMIYRIWGGWGQFDWSNNLLLLNTNVIMNVIAHTSVLLKVVNSKTSYPWLVAWNQVFHINLVFVNKRESADKNELESNPKSLLWILDKHAIQVILDSRIMYKLQLCARSSKYFGWLKRIYQWN